MTIRPFEQKDLSAVVALWNEAVERGDVVYKKINEEYYHRKFERDPNYDARYAFVADEEGQVIGFIHGTAKKIMLDHETFENTPGFITCLFVRSDKRRRGVGTALLNRLMDEFRAAGKTKVRCTESNPINLDWTIPGTPGHDHNNTPGIDLDGMAYPFMQKNGFEDYAHEIAMYLDLSTYTPWEGLKAKQEELLAQGIYTGRYDAANLDYDFDGMCDRVGSDYWRCSLRTEIEAWKQNKPNQDNRFIPNGKVPAGPRPILVATHDHSIVAFTGPVDKQESGRGWFTGICTDPLFERRGIASVLFNLLMQEFVAEGAAFSTLFTGEDNHAQLIYKRAGFEVRRRFAIMGRDL